MHNDNTLLARAVRALRESEPRAVELHEAAERVRRCLAARGTSLSASPIVFDCAGFRELIAAFRTDQLSAARRELFEDHIRSCASCRRLLWQQSLVPHATAARPRWRHWKVAAAAVLAATCGLTLVVALRRGAALPPPRLMVERVEGPLSVLRTGAAYPLSAGRFVGTSESVRTGHGGRAVLRLSDGSRVEMNEFTELEAQPRTNGLALVLHRGCLIVDAVPQPPGRQLFVLAPDCEVAVKGTIFAVSAGPKGSRISVLQGEVWVEHNKSVSKLMPGGQAVTQTNIAPVPIAAEVAWSSEPQRYAALLHDLGDVSRAMMARVADLPLRYDSQLWRLLPAETFLFAALPNVSPAVADAGLELERRFAANPELRKWLDYFRKSHPKAVDVSELMQHLRTFGTLLGDEIVFAVAGTPGEQRPRFELLAKTDDEVALAAAIRAALGELHEHSGAELPVVFVDDPAELPNEPPDGLYVLVQRGLLVATDAPSELLRLASGDATPPPATPFFTHIARCYEEGVVWLFAVDAERLFASARGTESPDTVLASELGLHDLQVMLLEHKRLASRDQLRGVFVFSRERRGVPAWLAAPAAMGALEFVTPNAYVVGCALTKVPSSIVAEVLAAIDTYDPEAACALERFMQERGLSLRQDLAAPLGTEFLLAIDGPLLPRPAWKLVVAVEDPTRLQHTLETLVASANDTRDSPLVLAARREGELQLFSLAFPGSQRELYWTFWDNYWIIAPQRLLVQQAVNARRSGLSLPTSFAFRRALPLDAQQHYSALLFLNTSSLNASLATAISNAEAQAGFEQLQKLLALSPAVAVCLTAEPERILLTGTGVDPLDFASTHELFSAWKLAAAGAPPNSQLSNKRQNEREAVH